MVTVLRGQVCTGCPLPLGRLQELALSKTQRQVADKYAKRIFKSLQLAVSRKYNLSGIRGLLRQAIAGYVGNNVPEIRAKSNVRVDVRLHTHAIVQRYAGI